MRKGVLLFSLLMFVFGEALAQVYPYWFLSQGELPCTQTAVGYAPLSYHADSSAARAFRNACENAARYSQSKLVGGEAFWGTEAGTFLMGSNIIEVFDGNMYNAITQRVVRIDSLESGETLFVLVGDSSCQLGKSSRQKLNLTQLARPAWTETLPSDAVYYYAVGVASEYFYETSSWLDAEQHARRNLARTVFVRLQSLQKKSWEGEDIRHEELSATLRKVQVVARWRDVKMKIFYVLARMPKEDY